MDTLANKNNHPRDQCIQFDPIPHKYTVNGEEGFLSVTTWLHSHFEAFDAKSISQKIVDRGAKPGSKYEGMTQEEIIASWEENGKQASADGTALHENIERFYNGVPVDPSAACLPDYQLFEAFRTQPRHQDLVPYRTEWMVWDSDLQLAGSIDMIFINSDGSLSIYDWKRCKDIQKAPRWGKFSKTKSIEHIPDTNYWHYALQLNTYAAILEKSYGKTVRDMQLVVLHPRQSLPMVLSVPPLKEEVEGLFRSRLNLIAT